MPYDLTNPLVIGISSRALFDLEEENRIFEEQGLAAYAEYQIKNEDKALKPGVGFELVRAFLRLNEHSAERRLVEVIVMSRNSPDTSLRIFNSIERYGLDITRAALAGGASVAPYLTAFSTDLFLSAEQTDVQKAINQTSLLFKWATGTGKSWALSAIYANLKERGLIRRVIILTSSIGVLNIPNELKKFLSHLSLSL